jgi:hypothetical protein
VAAPGLFRVKKSAIGSFANRRISSVKFPNFKLI